MSKVSRIVLAFVVFALVRTVDAVPPPANPIIPNITVGFDPNCDGLVRPLNLGSISATVQNGTGPVAGGGNGTPVGSSLMDATFSLSAAAKTAKVTNCANFYWLQEIYYDDAPVPYKPGGVDKTPPKGNYSIIDPPNGGWDYMYNGPGRTNPKPAYSNFIDNQPWYYNAAGQANFNNPGAGTYQIQDQPGNPGLLPSPPNPAGTYGVTRFDTFLVATPTMGCADANCLKAGEIDLLAGFAWTIQSSNPNDPQSSYINSIQFIPQAGNAADINTALTNAGFAGYTAVVGRNICCPEPAVAGLMMIGAMLTVARRRAA